jgi:hypothetical protein
MSGIVPAFEGVIDSNYFNISDPLVWTIDTTNNATAYLYLTLVSGQYDPTSVDSLETEVSFTEFRTDADLKTRILVAVAITTIGLGVTALDTNPEGNAILSEEIYDVEVTVGTDLSLDLRTILGTPTSVPELKFVTMCVTGFSELPVNPYFLWVEYNVGENPYAFTIKSTGSTSYVLTLKLLLKYKKTL